MRQFTSRNDVFSDFFNATTFGGEQVIQPSELENVDPKGAYRDLVGHLRELERDVVKFWRKGDVFLALLGIESQTAIDRDMPIRMYAYDALAYRAQLVNKHEKRRYPVISKALYYGARPWTQNLTLREIVEFPEGFGDALAAQFNDYKVNLVDMARFERADVEKFRSDFRFLSETYYKSVHPKFDTPPFPGTIADYRTTADVVNAILPLSNGTLPMPYKTHDEGECSMYDEFSILVRNLEANGEKRGIGIGEKRGIEIGEKRGIGIGEKRGIGIGEKQKARSVALRLKKKNMPFDEIVSTVEIEPETVREWFLEEEAKGAGALNAQ